MRKMRKEKDILGEIEVPADAYYGINTQRAIRNFRISGRTMPTEFIVALVQVKKACVKANMDSEKLNMELGETILKVIDEILIEYKLLDQFPVDIFQTGSGTQTNMNMNEVLANRANEILGHPMGLKTPVHPNNHVNMGQSSNDVIPTTMHLAALASMAKELFPSIMKLIQVLDKKIKQFQSIVKVGRTHLMDAVPIPLATEFSVYRKQFISAVTILQNVRTDLAIIPIGGTALGTGLNADEEFAERVVKHLSKITHIPFEVNPVKAEGIASHSVFVRLSGALRVLSLSLMKMANDIRWMASGPRSGIGELLLPENEPGSSIMPGKINPTQSEALIQVCMQVIGYDTTISLAEGYGSVLDLNVAKPVIIVNLLDALNILANGIRSFTVNCLEGLEANVPAIESQLERSLMLVTRLSPVIGYDKAGEIAKKAHESGKTIREIIIELGLEIENLDELLDPHKMV